MPLNDKSTFSTKDSKSCCELKCIFVPLLFSMLRARILFIYLFIPSRKASGVFLPETSSKTKNTSEKAFIPFRGIT
jgi:hypothetical protein